MTVENEANILTKLVARKFFSYFFFDLLNRFACILRDQLSALDLDRRYFETALWGADQFTAAKLQQDMIKYSKRRGAISTSSEKLREKACLADLFIKWTVFPLSCWSSLFWSINLICWANLNPFSHQSFQFDFHKLAASLPKLCILAHSKSQNLENFKARIRNA